MTQVEENALFDKVFADKGGIFSYEGTPTGYIFDILKKKALGYIESCITTAPLMKPPPTVVFNFIHNFRLNAIVRKHEDVYYVGVYAGTILILGDLFNWMMSHPKLMPEIGDVSKEKAETPEHRSYFNTLDERSDLNNILDENFQFKKPNDQVRGHFAVSLMNAAFDFLVVHEMAHVLHGHIDYHKYELGFNSYDEAENEIKTVDKILTIQTLEMDADCSATSSGMGNSIRRHLGKQPIKEATKPFYMDFNESAFHWMVAVSSLIRVWEANTGYKVEYNQKENTHPQPKLRQFMVLNTVHYYLKKFYPEHMDAINSDKINMLKSIVESTYKLLTGKWEDHEAQAKEIMKGKEYIELVLQHWKVIRPDLLKYTYTTLVE